MLNRYKTISGAVVFIFLSLLSLSWGTVPVSIAETAQAVITFLAGHGTDSIGADAVVYIRLPHFVLSFLIGCGLALCGTVMQAVTRNPLADPYLLGISSGASLGAVISIALGINSLLGISGIGAFAFIGAMTVCVLILVFSGFIRCNRMLTIILAGFAFNALCAAGVNFIVNAMAEPSKTRSVQFWLLGNIQVDDWRKIAAMGMIILAGFLYFLSQRRVLDLMLMGDEISITMGRNLARYRKIYILGTAFLTACMVFMTGTIGFVGLIIPHLVRLTHGSAHKIVLPLASLGGGCFLAWADVLGRTLVPGVSIPIGVASAACGAPFFIWMLLTGKWGGRK